jgi:hypothetical protein
MKNQSGACFVELTIAFPIMILLMSGVIWVGAHITNMSWNDQTAYNASMMALDMPSYRNVAYRTKAIEKRIQQQQAVHKAEKPSAFFKAYTYTIDLINNKIFVDSDTYKSQVKSTSHYPNYVYGATTNYNDFHTSDAYDRQVDYPVDHMATPDMQEHLNRNF